MNKQSVIADCVNSAMKMLNILRDSAPYQHIRKL
jgi:hypothetical protein